MAEKLDDIKQIVFDLFMRKSKELKIDFSLLDGIAFRKKAEAVFKSVLKENKEIYLNRHEQEEFIGEITSYILSLGPLHKLLEDPDITEIMVNGPGEIYVEREGNIEPVDAAFKDEQHLLFCVERILSPLGRRISAYEPYVDARLSDGSRVNIIRPPVSLLGTILSIRKFSSRLLTMDDLIKSDTLTEEVAKFLEACVVSRINTLICGGTSSGKTTLLNVLGSFIPKRERVISIEDTVELRLVDIHVIPLETRLANIEGKGEITAKDLVKNALHMRADRIIIGEVRSDEVLDMIQAMNTGHEGSMTTLHANSTLEALDRLEVLALMGRSNISSEVAKRQIISAVDLVVDMTRSSDGSRKITQISEVIKSKEYQLRDIFLPKKEGLQATGLVPTFYPRLKQEANYHCGIFEGK